MLVVITGGSKCNKSQMAENIIAQCDCKRYYIATMKPLGSDAEEAINRHRRMRQGKGFETIEQYLSLDTLMLASGSAVILECVGNLCANEMFSDQRKMNDSPEALAKKITSDIIHLADCSNLFVAVTNQVGEDGISYAKETMDYIRLLGTVNAGLCRRADVVIEAVFGIPLILKGKDVMCHEMR